MSNKQIEAISLEQAAKLAREALKVARDQIVDPDYAPIGWSVSRLDEVLQCLDESLAEQPAQQEPSDLDVWKAGSPQKPPTA